jgi:hypothetical protein
VFIRVAAAFLRGAETGGGDGRRDVRKEWLVFPDGFEIEISSKEVDSLTEN